MGLGFGNVHGHSQVNVICSFVARRSDLVQPYRIRAVKASVDPVGNHPAIVESPYPGVIHLLCHHYIDLACWHHAHDQEIGSVDAGHDFGSGSDSWYSVVASRSPGLYTRQLCKNVLTEPELTHLAAANCSPLLLLKCLNAGVCIKKLYKTIRLLY